MKRSSLWSRLSCSENFVGYLFLIPWLFGFLALTMWPLLDSLYLSLTDFNMLSANAPNFIGLDNYIRMFTADDKYLHSMKITFLYVFLAVPFKLAFALVVAVIMNQKLRLISLYRTVYYIPTLLGGSVAIAVLWKQIFGGDGIINSMIFSLTGIKAPAWVAHPDYAIYTLILLTVWQFGSSMIIFLAGLKQIPQEYYEAASVDGATPVKQFFHITIPSLSPVILFNLVMQTISAFQSFTQAYLIGDGKGGPLGGTLFYTLHLYLTGFTPIGHNEMGYAAAMAWVLLIIISTFTFAIFKSSGTWVNYAGGD